MAVVFESVLSEWKLFLTVLFSENTVYYGIVIGLIFGILSGWIARGIFGKESGEGKTLSLPSSGSGEYKMVLVVRQDLGMGKGKIAAQLLMKWENSASPKVVVKAPDENALIELSRKARAKGLETCLIRDAGRTQIAPGSKTVLGVGPALKEHVDEVTGHLKLF